MKLHLAILNIMAVLYISTSLASFQQLTAFITTVGKSSFQAFILTGTPVVCTEVLKWFLVVTPLTKT